MKIKLYLIIALAVVAGLFTAPPVQAQPPLETRMDTAEKVRLVVPFNVSGTINAAKTYAVPSPVNGWVTGLYLTYLGPNAITSGSSGNIVAKIGGVSLTTISLTVPSPTAVLAAISSTALPKDVSTTGRVNKGATIELDATGSPLMTGAHGGEANVVIEITPNYTPARFRQ